MSENSEKEANDRKISLVRKTKVLEEEARPEIEVIADLNLILKFQAQNEDCVTH